MYNAPTAKPVIINPSGVVIRKRLTNKNPFHAPVARWTAPFKYVIGFKIFNKLPPRNFVILCAPAPVCFQLISALVSDLIRPVDFGNISFKLAKPSAIRAIG